MIYRLPLLPKIPTGLSYWEKSPQKSKCQFCQSCAAAALEIAWPQSNIAQSHRGTGTAHRGSSHAQNRKMQQVKDFCSLCQVTGKIFRCRRISKAFERVILPAHGVFRYHQFHINVMLRYASYLYLTAVLHKTFHTKLAQTSLEKKSWAELENTPERLGDKASISFPD